MGELREAFDSAVSDAGDRITGADRAAVEAGRKLADRIDEAGRDTKAMYLVPHLVSVLRELHLTPASREKLPKDGPPKADPIDELLAKRNKRAGRKSA